MRSKGISLGELLVALTIIAVLVATGFSTYRGLQQRAATLAQNQDQTTFFKIFEAFRMTGADMGLIIDPARNGGLSRSQQAIALTSVLKQAPGAQARKQRGQVGELLREDMIVVAYDDDHADLAGVARLVPYPSENPQGLVIYTPRDLGQKAPPGFLLVAKTSPLAQKYLNDSVIDGVTNAVVSHVLKGVGAGAKYADGRSPASRYLWTEDLTLYAGVRDSPGSNVAGGTFIPPTSKSTLALVGRLTPSRNTDGYLPEEYRGSARATVYVFRLDGRPLKPQDAVFSLSARRSGAVIAKRESPQSVSVPAELTGGMGIVTGLSYDLLLNTLVPFNSQTSNFSYLLEAAAYPTSTAMVDRPGFPRLDNGSPRASWPINVQSSIAGAGLYIHYYFTNTRTNSLAVSHQMGSRGEVLTSISGMVDYLFHNYQFGSEFLTNRPNPTVASIVITRSDGQALDPSQLDVPKATLGGRAISFDPGRRVDPAKMPSMPANGVVYSFVMPEAFAIDGSTARGTLALPLKVTLLQPSSSGKSAGISSNNHAQDVPEVPVQVEVKPRKLTYEDVSNSDLVYSDYVAATYDNGGLKYVRFFATADGQQMPLNLSEIDLNSITFGGIKVGSQHEVVEGFPKGGAWPRKEGVHYYMRLNTILPVNTWTRPTYPIILKVSPTQQARQGAIDREPLDGEIDAIITIRAIKTPLPSPMFSSVNRDYFKRVGDVLRIDLSSLAPLAWQNLTFIQPPSFTFTPSSITWSSGYFSGGYSNSDKSYNIKREK